MTGYLYRLFRATENENRMVILNLLKPWPGARLLDLGCYDGSWTEELAKKIGAGTVAGVEVVPEVAARARTRGLTVIEADLNGPIPLPDSSFEVIHANQVIEHLHDTDRFASEIHRLLAPNGYAVISTNNLSSAHNIVSLLMGRQPPPAHVSGLKLVGNSLNPLEGDSHENPAMAHLRIFSYGALRSFLAMHGMIAEEYRTVGFYPFPTTIARVLCRTFPIYGAFLTCRVRRR